MKKIYLVPNFVTTLNLFCGFYSVIASINADFERAAWSILLAGVFDMLDGRIARLARATSSFGVQYDSMSDLVSFGIAPAILMYLWTLQPLGRLGWLAAFFFVTCGAFRLARFNVTSDEMKKSNFQGLPIPAGAGTVATFVIFFLSTSFLTEKVAQILTLVIALGNGILMVSSIPFPSFKELNWRSRASFGYLLVAVLSLILIAIHPEFMLFALNFGYIVLSLAWQLYKWVRGTPASSQIAPSRSPQP